MTDSYLTGTMPASEDQLAMLAFNMIRTELDRAMERSRRARQRAALRKTKSGEPQVLTSAELISSINEMRKKATESDGKPRRRLNRRERREIERQTRKYEKTLFRAKPRP